jgi:hypothetical protein
MTAASETTQSPIRIGISSCLLGEKVRFDSGYKRDPFNIDTLAGFFAGCRSVPKRRLVSAPEKWLDTADKEELMACLEDYHTGLVPLVMPVTLLKHHFYCHLTP